MTDEARSKRNLTVLSEQWHGCTRCELSKTREGPDIFFGFGEAQPRVLVIGSTPTAADEYENSMFAGDEGDLLLHLLREEANIPTEDCFFTYAVSCRPKVFIPATEDEPERIENRPPSKEELVACRPRLYEIVTVGEVATKAVVRGRLPKFVEAVDKQYQCVLFPATKEDHEDNKVTGKARYQPLVYPVFPIPDMNTIINNPSTAEHGPYRLAVKILKKVQDYTKFVIENEEHTMRG
jgi:uracil-DNA glycosylase family 4